MINEKNYLGDGVYVKWDGFQVLLTTENGIDTTNSVYMEPEVIEAFEVFVAKIKRFVKDYKPVQ